MKLYKLTDQRGYTRDNTKWGKGVTHYANDGPPLLCSDTVLHAYTSPELALFLNPIHATIGNPRLWEAEGQVVVANWDKVGCKQLTTTKELTVQMPTSTQCVAFGILCAKEVYSEPSWVRWADNWLNTQCRTRRAAAAADAADAAADAANAADAAKKGIDFQNLAIQALKY